MAITINSLTFHYGTTPVLKGVTMAASEGEITAIIGPNAAGKSTLLKCIAGVLKSGGNIYLNGTVLEYSRTREASRSIGYLPQERIHHPVLTVFEVVLLGRLHSLSWRVDNETLELVMQVLEEIGIGHLAAKNFDDLSGGEKQLVTIAQVLIQAPSVILMDEPIGGLDLQHQVEILDILQEVTRARGIITIVVLHDLSMAARYCANLIVMDRGNVHSSGKPAEVLTPDMLRQIYHINARVINTNGIIQVIPECSLRKIKNPADILPEARFREQIRNDYRQSKQGSRHRENIE